MFRVWSPVPVHKIFTNSGIILELFAQRLAFILTTYVYENIYMSDTYLLHEIRGNGHPPPSSPPIFEMNIKKGGGTETDTRQKGIK